MEVKKLELRSNVVSFTICGYSGIGPLNRLDEISNDFKSVR